MHFESSNFSMIAFPLMICYLQYCLVKNANDEIKLNILR